MKKRFILVIDNPTKEQQNAVTNFFKNRRLGYWHWLSDVWLLTDSRNTWTATSIRDKVKELVPGTRLLVFSIGSGTTWAGSGKTEMFKWLHNTWKR